MALGINTNVASINAQNQLSKSQSQNDQALERLSSGLRINSAKDDAAGLAISTRFESQIGGLNQASRNANDGISLAQTAEGALDEVTNNLQRIRDLSVQAANATNSESDREALNDEVEQRIEEINRISSETSFNGLNVLDGSLDTQDFQVGANVGQTIGVDLSQGTKADQIGSIASESLDVAAAVSDSSGSEGLSVAVGDGELVSIDPSDGFTGETDRGQTADSAFAIADAIKAADVDGLNVQANNVENVGTVASAGTEGALEINGVDIGDDEDITSTEEMRDAINDVSGSSGVSASIVNSDEIELTAEDGRNIELNTALQGRLDDADSGTIRGTVDVSAQEEITFENTGDSDISTVFSNLDSSETDTVEVNDNEGLDDADISSVSGANDAIFRVDAALESVNGLRSELGAVQNRFESTISNLDSNVENLEASNSRIKDADFASESAKLSQSQVLQQAGISVLSQANQKPQQVLSLLQ